MTMPLINFGSILNFAEEIEAQDRDFYRSAGADPALEGGGTLFEPLADECDKHIKVIQRTRRENVTEMILENVAGFTRDPFILDCREAAGLTMEEALAASRKIEDRAVRYYQAAAEKLKGQPEVALALKQLAKKRRARLNRLGA
jgi:rubrerythrin